MIQKAAGKRVFLLYPSAAVQDELLDFLIAAGFEAYVLRDHQRALKILLQLPGSIMFIDIDEGLTEPEWETYIKDIQKNPQYRCELGILSFNNDIELMRKYLMEIGVPCGYIQLKDRIEESVRIMFNALEANESHDTRRYTRVSCEHDPLAALTVKNGQDVYRGRILIVSAACVEARFEQFPKLSAGAALKDVELTLGDECITIDVIPEKKRRPNEWRCNFDPSRMDRGKGFIIHNYIKTALEERLNKLKL